MTDLAKRTARSEALAVFALGALAIGLAVACHGLINAFPYGLTDDDAWFYSRIAYQLGTTGRATFDGIHLTSGFHLLWGGLLASISAGLGVFGVGLRVHLYAHEAAYFFIALLLARGFAERATDRFSLFALTIVSTMLMETLLVAALLLVFLRLSEGTPTPARRRLALAALALVPLARIDAALIPLVLAAILLAARRGKDALGIAMATAAGMAVQVALMVAFFGHPFSVSSMIKVAGSHPGVSTLFANLRGPESLSPGFVLRALVFFILAAGVFARPGGDDIQRGRRLGIAAGTCLFTLGHLVAHRIPFWCYLPSYLVLFYLLIQGNSRDFVRRAASLATLGVLVVFLAHKLIDAERHRSVAAGARDFVTRVAAAVPSDGRIYQFDGAGFVGFFSGRSVIDGDGLVNTYEYAIRAERGALAGYLDDEGICFVIDNVNRGASDVMVDHGGLVIRRSELDEILRTGTYGQHPTTDFALYRRRTEACRVRTARSSSIRDR